MKQDFIVINRTRLYFIDDMFNITSGIVAALPGQDIETISGGSSVVTYAPVWDLTYNSSSEISGYYVSHKLPNTENEYEIIFIPREYLFFTEDDARIYQVIKLKEFIANKQTCTFLLHTTLPFDSIIDKAYLFETNKNIFSDDSDSVVSVIYDDLIGAADFDLIPNPELQYKLVYRISDIIWTTPITNATVYNDEFNEQQIEFTDCVELEYPEDYLQYITHVVNLPESLNTRQIKFAIKKHNYIGDYIASTEFSTVLENEQEVSTNRYIPYGYKNNSLAYYIPDWKNGYDLYMMIWEEDQLSLFKFTSVVEEFSENVTFDFNGFVEIQI